MRYMITIATENGNRTIFKTANRARVLERFNELKGDLRKRYPDAWGMIAEDTEAYVNWMLAWHKERARPS